MAKGKRTYVAFYSKETGNMLHVTNVNKRNFAPGEKLTLKKYNPVTRKREEVVMKEIKKGGTKARA